MYIVDDPCKSDGLNNIFKIKNVKDFGPKGENIKHNFDMQCHLKLTNETRLRSGDVTSIRNSETAGLEIEKRVT